MEAIRAYYDGNAFVPLTPVKARRNQQAIITILEETKENPAQKRFQRLYGQLDPVSYQEITDALKDAERVDVS
jgi:hypothetical protein